MRFLLSVYIEYFGKTLSCINRKVVIYFDRVLGYTASIVMQFVFTIF